MKYINHSTWLSVLGVAELPHQYRQDPRRPPLIIISSYDLLDNGSDCDKFSTNFDGKNLSWLSKMMALSPIDKL